MQVTGSHPARGAWIEIRSFSFLSNSVLSHPARGAWIEIEMIHAGAKAEFVAPREGCVD